MHPPWEALYNLFKELLIRQFLLVLVINLHLKGIRDRLLFLYLDDLDMWIILSVSEWLVIMQRDDGWMIMMM